MTFDLGWLGIYFTSGQQGDFTTKDESKLNHLLCLSVRKQLKHKWTNFASLQIRWVCDVLVLNGYLFPKGFKVLWFSEYKVKWSKVGTSFFTFVWNTFCFFSSLATYFAFTDFICITSDRETWHDIINTFGLLFFYSYLPTSLSKVYPLLGWSWVAC